MAEAVVIEKTGGPEVFTWQSVEVPKPAHGEVRLKQTAVGLNYIDVYHRSGLYPVPSLPAIVGMEAAGIVTELGDGVTNFSIGDHVAYAGQLGAYATERNIASKTLVKVPDDISDEQAAAMMLQGMTVRYLLRETYPVTADTTILFHAAAGGVGLIACQWARALGAKLIGTVGSDEKAELAKANGATHTINYRSEDFVERVHDLTDGKGCDAVYDSIGKDTFPQSLDCLRPKGLWVSFGNASGPVPAFDLSALKGSLFACRPSLMAYTADRRDLVANADDLFSMVQSGELTIPVRQTYALRDAAKAHRDLEARKTTGSTVMTV